MLFLNYIIYLSSFFGLIAGEDSFPVPGTSRKNLRLYGNMYGAKKRLESQEPLIPHVSNEDELFESLIPKLPWQLQLKNKYTFYRQGIIENPATATIGGATGSVFGYGYMQAYLKGTQLGAHHFEHNPKISITWPKLTSFLKKAAQPNNPCNRGMMIYTIGHYCVIGAGVAISKNEKIQGKWNKFLNFFKKKI